MISAGPCMNNSRGRGRHGGRGRGGYGTKALQLHTFLGFVTNTMMKLRLKVIDRVTRTERRPLCHA